MQNTTHYNQRLNINELNNTTNLEEAIKNAEHLYISNLLGDEELLSSINSYLKKYNKKLWLSLDKSSSSPNRLLIYRCSAFFIASSKLAVLFSSLIFNLLL